MNCGKKKSIHLMLTTEVDQIDIISFLNSQQKLNERPITFVETSANVVPETLL